MNLKLRNNVNVVGHGTQTILMVHGFGCDQNMWRYFVPSFQDQYKIILLDLVGSGNSDISAYSREKYSTLYGYADDLIEVIEEFVDGSIIFVGHSVSAIIGLLASIKKPALFSAQVMIGPSPCYINDGEYIGGFTREDIDELNNTIDNNYLGWSSAMAPAIMGNPEKPELGLELTNSFCRTDPEIAKHFAYVTFLSDYRSELPKSTIPALILQCSDDFIAPISVGEYMQRNIPDSTLNIIQNSGHCPHLSSPESCAQSMKQYLASLSL